MSVRETPAVSVNEVSRLFGGSVALDRVSLRIKQGTVHAFVGENGAGKSTLAGIIAGRLAPTAGEISVLGEEIKRPNVKHLRDRGVMSVYQELTIIPGLSTQANLFLGSWESRAGLLREGAMRRRLLELNAGLGVNIPPDVLAGRLSIAAQQILEIMRALHHQQKLIIFDEPTAALTIPERETFARIVARFRDAGVTQILVSHDLNEVRQLADYVSVFRDGRIVETARVADRSKAELVAAMQGPVTRGDVAVATRSPELDAPRVPALRLRGLTLPGRAEPIDLTIFAGEVLGLAGIVGAGRSSLLRAIFGAGKAKAKEVEVGGRLIRLPRSPREAIRRSIGMIPDDRKAWGIVPHLSLADNVVLADISKCARRGVVTRSRVLRAAQSAIDGLRVPDHRLSVPAANLSGGTQQKSVAGRWSHRPATLLLADEPTRGIDIGAKADVLRALKARTSDGVGAVVLTSTESADLVEVCDRVLVLREGRIVASMTRGEHQFTADAIDRLAGSRGSDVREEVAV